MIIKHFSHSPSEFIKLPYCQLPYCQLQCLSTGSPGENLAPESTSLNHSLSLLSCTCGWHLRCSVWWFLSCQLQSVSTWFGNHETTWNRNISEPPQCTEGGQKMCNRSMVGKQSGLHQARKTELLLESPNSSRYYYWYPSSGQTLSQWYSCTSISNMLEFIGKNSI